MKQKQTKMRLFFTLLAVVILSGNFFAQEGIMNQGEMVSKNVYHEIQFTNTKEEIVQFVKLKNNSFKFIFDSGAPLAISYELQNSLQFPILHLVPLKDAHNNSDTIKIVLVDTIRVGALIFKDIPAVVIDLKNSPIGCQNIDGIVGSNIARFLIVQFDLSRNKIMLTDHRNKFTYTKTGEELPVVLDNQSNAFLKIHFNDTLIDTPHFDSGMGKLYDMNLNTALTLANIENKKPGAVYKGFGIPGQGILGNAKEESVYLINTNFRLGSNRIENAQIGTTQTVSRIGREILNYGTLTIDYINKQYSFKKYQRRLNKPKSNYGFEILVEENKVSIGIVWENTRAQKIGLTTGAEIVEVNGNTFQNKTSCEIEKILSREFSEKKLRVTYLDNGLKKNVVFKKIKPFK